LLYFNDFYIYFLFYYTLIVIPLSIYNNWIEEVERFSKLTIYKFRGYREERGEMKKYLTQHV